jgi:hypothetical protein
MDTENRNTMWIEVSCPVRAGEAIELRLLPVPENTQRQEAHQVGSKLRRHGAQRAPQVLLGVNGRARGGVQVESRQRHRHREYAVAQGRETFHALAGDPVVYRFHPNLVICHGSVAQNARKSCGPTRDRRFRLSTRRRGYGTTVMCAVSIRRTAAKIRSTAGRRYAHCSSGSGGLITMVALASKSSRSPASLKPKSMPA